MRIDLISDTVTRPTADMLAAMQQADVGDDVHGEDPTVNRLEAKAAEMFGCEAGVFCPSGTMTNQIAIKVHTQPGEEVICDQTAHVYKYEGGGIGANSGCQAHPLTGVNGQISAAQVEAAINPPNDHYAQAALVCVENSCNRAGGSCYSMEQLQSVGAVAERHGLKYHLDGARIFNAAVAKGFDVRELGGLFDSISVCLSKGLGAPVGSLLLGSEETIRKARRVRKRMGGGMRQAGYLAAAGIYALDHHIDRLAEDHRRARITGELLQALPFVKEVLPVETNIVIFRLTDDMPLDTFIKVLESEGIRGIPFGRQTMRLTFHYDVTADMFEHLKGVLSHADLFMEAV